MTMIKSIRSGQRCLVLGGKGFIGSHLCTRLLKIGYIVRIFDRPTNSGDKKIEYKNGLEIYKGDFVNQNDLASAIEGVDFIFHLISTTTPKTSNDNPIYDIETNLVGSLGLLEIVKSIHNVKIIFISSGGTVYGVSNEYPIPEKCQTKPICSYGVAKLAIENYLYTYNYLYDIDYTVLRVSNPFGEKQNPKSIQGAVPVFMLKLLEREKITIWGDGEIARDFIYIDDVIDAFILAMQYKSEHRIFNIGSGVATTMNNLIQKIEKISGISPVLEYIDGRVLDVPKNYLDVSLARTELEWKPKTTLTEGLQLTWKWIKSQYMENRFCSEYDVEKKYKNQA